MLAGGLFIMNSPPFLLINYVLMRKKKTPLAGDCGVFIETETLTVFWEPMSFMDCFVSHVCDPARRDSCSCNIRFK
jgi:hypothetical protein